MTPQNMLLIGGGSIIVLYLLSQKPADDAVGGAGGEGVEKKEPSEAAETIFITTEQKAVEVKKEATATEGQWESLYKTIGEYTPQTPGYLAIGDYVRYSETGRPIYGPTHKDSPYAKAQGFIPKVKSSSGRAARVAAWKKVHGEPTYSGTTHHQKASN